jgi:hypothetical protein
MLQYEYKGVKNVYIVIIFNHISGVQSSGTI